MTATVWRMLRVVAWSAVPASTLLIPGCLDGPVGPYSYEVVASVTGTVGVAGAWLSGTPVKLGASSLALAGPSWSRTFDESTTNSNGAYALRGVMDRDPDCTWAYVVATFDIPPFSLSQYLALNLRSVCDVAEVAFEVHFPVRRTDVIAQGRILWNDGSAAQGVDVVLRTYPISAGDHLDATRTDSNGDYRVEAAVLDAICDPESEFVGSGHTWLRVSDEGGVHLGDSGPLACGVNQVDLIATWPAGDGPVNAPAGAPTGP